MHFKKAILENLVTYLATIITGLGIALAAGIPLDVTAPPSDSLLLMSMVVATVFTILGAVWYFRQSDVRAGLWQGVAFGVLAIVIGFVLDVVFASVPLFLGGEPSQFLSRAYAFWFMGIMLGIVLLATAALGWTKSRKLW